VEDAPSELGGAAGVLPRVAEVLDGLTLAMKDPGDDLSGRALARGGPLALPARQGLEGGVNRERA
jgi:hypothetical protein